MENYNKMYQNEISTVPVEETVDIPTIVEEPEPPLPVYGRVVNCDRLNVREEPDSAAEVVCVIKALTDVEIDEGESTDEFYKVYLSSGLEGYCMKKFIVMVQP